MSKRSRRRKAKDSERQQVTSAADSSLPGSMMTNDGQATLQSSLPEGAPKSRFKRYRKLLLVVAALVALLIGILLTKKKGAIDYTSDDPNAQVVLEKDGQEIFLERGTHIRKKLEPGSYKLRLDGSSEGLELRPRSLNLDPDGLGIITVRRVARPPQGK